MGLAWKGKGHCHPNPFAGHSVTGSCCHEESLEVWPHFLRKRKYVIDHETSLCQKCPMLDQTGEVLTGLEHSFRFSTQTADTFVGMWVRTADSGKFSTEKTQGEGAQGEPPREGISAKEHMRGRISLERKF